MKFILLLVLFVAILSIVNGRRLRSPYSFRNRRKTIPQAPKGKNFAAFVGDKKPPKPTIHWIRQPVNHFGFEEEGETFMEQYLIYDGYYDPSKSSSILFYTGNEGSIDQFYDNSGAMFEFAQEFGSLVVFAESRYYGKSMIYKKGSKTEVDYRFFSAEQVLADYALLLKMLKEKYSIKKVISFGGSLGAMYAAYFRIKYPHIIDGAWCASGPVLNFPGQCNPYDFSKIPTDAFYKFGCGPQIRDGFAHFAELQKSGQYKVLNDRFHTCQGVHDAKMADKLDMYVENAILYMAMVNYPAPASFLQPLPGYPIKATCERINSKKSNDPLEPLFDVTTVFFNYTGQTTCFDLDGWENSNDLGFESWDYQACSEMVLATGSNGQTDFLIPHPYNLQNISDDCFHEFGIRPRATWMTDYYGIDKSQYSRIIFTNGEYDPWRGGGYAENHPDREITSIYIKEGAHHTCLRFSTPQDPPTVVEARNQVKSIIKGWIMN